MRPPPLDTKASAGAPSAGPSPPAPGSDLMFSTASKSRALFVADVWAHFVSWSVLDLYLANTFWFNLNPKAFSYLLPPGEEPPSALPWNALFVVSYMGVPFLLLIRPVVRLLRRWFYYLTAVPALVLILKHLFDTETQRTILLFIGSVTVLFRYVASFARPLDDGRRFQYPMASTIGLLLLQIVRWACASTNPLSVRSYSTYVMALLALVIIATRLVIREERKVFKETEMSFWTEAEQAEAKRRAELMAEHAEDENDSNDDEHSGHFHPHSNTSTPTHDGFMSPSSASSSASSYGSPPTSPLPASASTSPFQSPLQSPAIGGGGSPIGTPSPPQDGVKKRRARSAESSKAASTAGRLRSTLTGGLRRMKRTLSVSSDLYWLSQSGFQPISGFGRTLAWVLSGALLGSHLFLVAWLFNEPGVIPRWVGLHPYPYALCVMLAFGVGVALALLFPLLTIRTAYLSLAAVGAPLLAYGDGGWGLFGGCLIAMSLPAYNFCLFGRNSLFAHASVSICQQLAVAGVVFTMLFFGAVGVLFGRSAPPPLSSFRHSPQALLFVTVGLMWGSAILERQIGNCLIRSTRNQPKKNTADITIVDPAAAAPSAIVGASDAAFEAPPHLAAAAVPAPAKTSRIRRVWRRATALFTAKRSGITSVDQERRTRALTVLVLVAVLVLLPTALVRTYTQRVITVHLGPGETPTLIPEPVITGSGGVDSTAAPVTTAASLTRTASTLLASAPKYLRERVLPTPATVKRAQESLHYTPMNVDIDTVEVLNRLSYTGPPPVNATATAKPKPASPSDDGFVVMTLNIQQGHNQRGQFNGDGIVELIRQYNVSVIGLQESDSVHVFTGNVDILNYVSSELHMSEEYGLPTRASSVGVAVLSYLALGPTRAISLPTTNGVGEFAEARCLQRQLVESSFVYGTTVITLMVVHVEYMCIADRQAQSEFIAARIRATSGPLLLIGDFNTKPDSPEMITLFATGIKEATIEAGTATDTEVVVGEGQVDFILFRDLSLRYAMIDTDPNHSVSDHRPVIAKFGLL